ncbi:MAG TPA: O-antigen ligase family protein [Phycisphaerales bacterium]|nr:O-antigen ligase family protein [Phycisphaerales bacterium]
MPNIDPSAAISHPPGRWKIPAAPWISRTKVQHLFDTDPWTGLFGKNITLAAAYLWCFLVTWPVSVVELAGVPLLVCTLLRMHRNWRYIPSILLQPLPIAASIFGLVQLASGLWTLDHRQWVEQAGAMRWLWSLFVLWPLIQHRRGFIIALTLGALVGNCTQLSQFLHTSLGWPTPTWPRAPDRYSGWWPPVVCGTILTAVLGLHLPSIFFATTTRERVFAASAATLTLVCIFASGTRGAWLAALGLITLTTLTAIIAHWRRPSIHAQGRSSRTTLLLIAAGTIALLVTGGIVWGKLGGSISRRYDLARDEIRAALNTGEYRTDTGARIGMAIWAIEHFREHPIRGVGAGSYRPATQALLAARGVDPSRQAVHDHAHNAILQIAATTGLLGLLPALSVVLLAFANAFGLGRERAPGLGAYEWGPLCALTGLALISLFDPVHINAQTSALLALILSLCPSFIPPPSQPAPPACPAS